MDKFLILPKEKYIFTINNILYKFRAFDSKYFIYFLNIYIFSLN